MNFSCENINDSGTFITFPASLRSTLCRASSGIPDLGSFVSSVEKNCLWRLWAHPSHLLRPENPQGSRPALRRYADLFGSRDPPSSLWKVPESEAGEARLFGRFSFLHQTGGLLRRPPLPGFEYSGYSRRSSPGLEDRQGLGDAVHARAVAPRGSA